MWDKTIDTLEDYFLKSFQIPPRKYHYLARMRKYLWGNFVDFGLLFYGTQELTFPLDIHGNFHLILLSIVPHLDH